MVVDTHYTSLLGIFPLLWGAEPLTEWALGINIVGAQTTQLSAAYFQLILFLVGVLMLSKGGTRAAEWVEDIVGQ